ncbi:MAG: hypothetical protein MJE77_16125 [Proteobacteria bacterium]|nr:hypothetical protein [Pseudomonadota bacterium]
MRTEQNRGQKPASRRTITARISSFKRLLRRHHVHPGAPLQRERVLLILSLARKSPVGVPELRAIVRAMEGKPYYGKVRRLQHQPVARGLCQKLVQRGLLKPRRKGWRRFFAITEPARAILATK